MQEGCPVFRMLVKPTTWTNDIVHLSRAHYFSPYQMAALHCQLLAGHISTPEDFLE